MLTLKPYGYRDANLFRLMDEMGRNFNNGNAAQLRCDIIDKEDHYLLQTDLPGFKREDIDIKINDGVLTINAISKKEGSDSDKENGYMRRERYYGSYSRSFGLEKVDADAIKAEYKDGVLALVLPKIKEEEPAMRKIEITG